MTPPPSSSGLVVSPWSSTYDPAGLLSLTFGPDGTATGGLVNTTISFMPRCEQRIARAAIADVVRDTDTPEISYTDLHASHLCNDDSAPFAIGLQVPRCLWEYEPATGDDDRWRVWFLDPDSRSWARCDHTTRHPALAGSSVWTAPALGRGRRRLPPVGPCRPAPNHAVALHRHTGGTTSGADPDPGVCGVGTGKR